MNQKLKKNLNRTSSNPTWKPEEVLLKFGGEEILIHINALNKNKFIILMWPNIVFFLKWYLLSEIICIGHFTRNIWIFEFWII